MPVALLTLSVPWVWVPTTWRWSSWCCLARCRSLVSRGGRDISKWGPFSTSMIVAKRVAHPINVPWSSSHTSWGFHGVWMVYFWGPNTPVIRFFWKPRVFLTPLFLCTNSYSHRNPSLWTQTPSICLVFLFYFGRSYCSANGKLEIL